MRDSKNILHSKLGVSPMERQYGGGLDDTYLNMSRRRSNAFADPNANTAFASPMSIGGLPTVYRYYGGATGDENINEDFENVDFGNPETGAPTAPAAPIYFSSPDPEDPFRGPRSIAPPAPPAPTTGGAGPDIPDWAWSVDDKGISSIVGPEGQVDPNYEHAASGIEGRQELLDRWRGKKEADGMLRLEYVYLNDIMDKTGMTITEAEDYLASVMATPGGVAAMEEGFNLGYTGGGPSGTIGNFIGGVGADLGLQEIAAREKRRKADPYDDFGVKERDDSFIGSIKDTVSRFFQGNRGITTEEGKEDFKEVLADKGATFIPHQESLLSGAISVGNTLLNPISGISSVLEFITGATPLGTIVTKEGIRFALDANYNVIPEQSIKEYDEGNVTTPATRQKPLEKKKSTKKEEKKKDTTKKTDNTEKIKASKIERLKTYMSLTGKDLSDSKQDLAITDISITEEDFT